MYREFNAHDDVFEELQQDLEDYFAQFDWDEGIRLNRRRGLAAQRRLARGLRGPGDIAKSLPGFHTRQEVGVVKPSGARGRLDLVPSGTKLAPFVYESKFIDLNSRSYASSSGGLNVGAISRRVARDASQARIYQQAVRGNRNIKCRVMPCRVRLVYQIPQTTPRARYLAFVNLSRGIAAQQGIPVTVVMPGSRLSHAFE
ncbi:MAG: hypothetical protein LUQ11_01085 [Methylococcaceae bacterium]|nr:hypothetical protein [Methylococcaceae bacterium]